MGTRVPLSVKQGNVTSLLLLHLTELSESCKGADRHAFTFTQGFVLTVLLQRHAVVFSMLLDLLSDNAMAGLCWTPTPTLLVVWLLHPTEAIYTPSRFPDLRW